MTAVLILANPEIRAKACRWIMAAPDKARLRLDEPKRTLDQNAKFHAMLTELVEQKPVLNGVKLDADGWKLVLMQALGMEMRMLPTLDGNGWFPMGHKSSKLSVRQFSDLVELLYAYGAEQGIVFSV